MWRHDPTPESELTDPEVLHVATTAPRLLLQKPKSNVDLMMMMRTLSPQTMHTKRAGGGSDDD